ncbi:hypothetical protein SEUCBS139899_010881 [Sporothrix eucalyptigena]
MLQAAGLDSSTGTPFTLLDHACGSGVTAAILNRAVGRSLLEKSSILCADVSEPMVDLVKRRIANEGWINTTAERRDAQSSGLPNGFFTHVTIGMGLHIIPDPDAALKDCIRVLKLGGTLAFTTFPQSAGDYGWVPDARSAFESFPTEIPFWPVMQLHNSGRWFDESWVEKTLVDHGFQNVKVVLHSYPVPIDGPEHFVQQFGMMFDMFRKTQWNDELREKYSREDTLERVKAHLQEKYRGKGWDLTFTVIVGSGQIPE